MNDRQRVRAILHYEAYDRIPVVSFGYWEETLDRWAKEGYIKAEDAEGYRKEGDNSAADRRIMDGLGFDFNWNRNFSGATFLFPAFRAELIRTEQDGSRITRNSDGLLIREKPGVTSIPGMIGTSMTGREAWEELYLPRLRFCEERVDANALKALREEAGTRALPLGLHCGSLYGKIRDMLGVEGLSYLMADDEELYEEIVFTVAELCFRVAEYTLNSAPGVFDFAHFWEDICFNGGPLIRPELFRTLVAPGYKRITELLKKNGIDIVSLDCDGCIDRLVPIWLENGVNTMFPIEVGTWHASVAPWRTLYGKDLHGVGGMDKRVFAKDKAAVDREIERLKQLVDLGGYIPCPDHRIAPDACYPLVAYYCEQFRKAFG